MSNSDQPASSEGQIPPPTPYSILGIPEGASEEQIKSAYRSGLFKWHPDTSLDSEATEEQKELHTAKLIEVQEAYRRLTGKQDSTTQTYSRDDVQRAEPAGATTQNIWDLWGKNYSDVIAAREAHEREKKENYDVGYARAVASGELFYSKEGEQRTLEIVNVFIRYAERNFDKLGIERLRRKIGVGSSEFNSEVIKMLANYETRQPQQRAKAIDEYIQTNHPNINEQQIEALKKQINSETSLICDMLMKESLFRKKGYIEVPFRRDDSRLDSPKNERFNGYKDGIKHSRQQHGTATYDTLMKVLGRKYDYFAQTAIGEYIKTGGIDRPVKVNSVELVLRR